MMMRPYGPCHDPMGREDGWAILGEDEMEFPNEHLAGIDCGVPMRFDSTELDLIELGRFAAARLEVERYLASLGLVAKLWL